LYPSVLNANLVTFGLVAADLTPLTNARNDFQAKPKRFSFRVAYRGRRERDEGTPSPEETVSVGG
jgi:hypothetical protein